MKLFKSKKAATVLITAGLLVGGAGAAFAYFTASGNGTGQATVGSSTNWGVVAGSATGTMYPGSGTSTVPFTITNNGSGAQAYSSLTASIVADGSGNVKQSGVAVSGCLASWFTPTVGTPSVATGTSIAAAGTSTVSVGVVLADSGTNQDPCQGVTPDVKLNVA